MITIFYERLKRYSLWSSQEIKWFPCKFACNLNLFVIFTFIFIEIRFEKDLAEDVTWLLMMNCKPTARTKKLSREYVQGFQTRHKQNSLILAQPNKVVSKEKEAERDWDLLCPLMIKPINDSFYSCVFFFLTGFHFFHLVLGLLLISLFYWSSSFSSLISRTFQIIFISGIFCHLLDQE